MEERRKREEQRLKEEQERLEQDGNLFGIKFSFPDYRRKRKNKFIIPFEQEIMDLCVTCSACNIF